MSVLHPTTPEELEILHCYGVTQAWSIFLLIFGWATGLLTGVAATLFYQQDNSEKQ